jgi:hypothetical protein
VKGSREDRRILGGCLLGGVGVGAVAAVGAAAVFEQEAEFEVCSPTTLRLCRHLEVVGFDLTSRGNAAAVIGPIVGFVAFLTFLVFVLYSDTQQRSR